MRTFSVYCLYNNKTNEIFYVGSTIRDVKKRFMEHFKLFREATHSYIISHNREDISYAIIEKCEEYNDMFDAEYYWTNYYNKFFNLVNVDIGRFHGKSFFEKMSGKNHPQYGKPVSEETKAKLRKWALDHPLSEEDKRKAVLARTGKPCSQIRKDAISRALREKWSKEPPTFHYVKVMLTNTGEIFESIKAASEKYNVPSTHISANCKGKRKSAGKKDFVKLVWKYV